MFYAVAQYIRHHKPCVVLLENVPELKTVNGGRDFREVLAELEKAGSYKIHWKVLNTRDQSGPQNRPRLFIMCIREDVDRGTFAWPEPLGVPPEIDHFLDGRTAQPDETDAFAPKGRAASKTFGAKMSKLTKAGKDPLRESLTSSTSRTPTGSQ